MHNLNIDLNHLFGPSTVERGFDYFRKNQVRALELEEPTDDELAELTAEVRGQKGKVYQVSIYLGACTDDPDEDPLEGICSCPMRLNCKHVCAVLLAAEQEYGAARINQLLGKPAEGISSEGLPSGARDPELQQLEQLIEQTMREFAFGASGAEKEALKKEILRDMFGVDSIDDLLTEKPARHSALDDNRKNWLLNLKRVVSSSTKGDEQVQATNRTSTNCVVYILQVADYSNDIIAQTYLSRYLKKGGFGKPNLYTNAYNCLHHNNWPGSMDRNDKSILKLAYIHDHLDMYDSEISLKDEEGYDLLNKILETGRCLIDPEKRLPVEKGEKVQGEIRWQLDEKGLQRPFLFDAKTDHPLQLLPTEPSIYLRILRDKAECGELTHVPSGDVLRALLNAPPLDETGVEETAKTLKSLFKGRERKAVQMPRKIETLTVEPEPLLILDGLHWKGPTETKGDFFQYSKKQDKTLTGNTREKMARARLFFSYKGQEVPLGSPLNTIKAGEDDNRFMPRQRQLESRLSDMLPPALHPAHQNCMSGGALGEYDLVMGRPGADYQRHWMHFMTQDAPVLEENGWKIKIEDSFPFQFETLSESDWYAELDESEMDWFTLRLGININGKSVDLLPLLARQIDHLPDQEQLKRLDKDALVPVSLPGGKYVSLPAERLRLILGTLLELFGDRPLEEYRLQPHHAEIWEELYNELDLPWAGGEKLLELGRKLKSFKKLKKVKPANTLQAELRPYQQHGLSWLQFLREYGLNGILADDMGLGKTLQTLAHIQLEKQRLASLNKKTGEKLKPSLVVCPTSLIHNWKHEAGRFTPELNVHIHHGSNRDIGAFNEADLVLTSYGIVQRDLELLAKTRFHLLALDEAQAVKNPNAKGAKSVRCLQAEHKICLTGTPMENHLGELWSLFDFLMPGFLGAREQFTRFYRTPIEKQNSREQSQRLQRRVAPFMLRRSKDLVAKELPPKTEIIRTTALNGKQRDLYETIRASMEARVKKEIEKKGLASSQIIILDALLKMRQACCDPSLVKLEEAKKVQESVKLDLLMDLIQPMVEEGRKILLFSQFTSMLELIEARLKPTGIKWVKLTGQTRHRGKPVKSFQNGDVPIFLISLKAGGTGLNLTAADTVIHYDPWWNPAVEDQASDRAHRIGQDKPVFVYKLVTEGTVEEKIQELKEKKRAIAASLYGEEGGKKKQSITAEDLDVLFEPLQANNA